jgi:putative transposase
VPARPATPVNQQQLAERLQAQAKEQGDELLSPDGLLNQLTKRVLETALEAVDQRAPRLRPLRPDLRSRGSLSAEGWL